MRTFVDAARESARWLFLLLTIVGLLGCPVRFVSAYDEVTDRMATELHGQIEAFLAHLEVEEGGPEAAYEANELFYLETAARMRALLARAQALPQNDETVRLLELLIDSLDKLRQLHEKRGERGLSARMIANARSAFVVSFQEIARLEMAKKEGR